MTEGEMLELEQQILEIMNSEPIGLMHLFEKFKNVTFVEYFTAICNLLRNREINYHGIGGKPFYSRTFKGFERQARYHE